MNLGKERIEQVGGEYGQEWKKIRDEGKSYQDILYKCRKYLNKQINQIEF